MAHWNGKITPLLRACVLPVYHNQIKQFIAHFISAHSFNLPRYFLGIAQGLPPLFAIYSAPPIPQLGQDTVHDFSSYVGQSKVPALVGECQSGVVDAQQVKYGGVKVVHMHWVLDDVV